MPEVRPEHPSRAAQPNPTLDAFAGLRSATTAEDGGEPALDLGGRARQANLRARMFGVRVEPMRVGRFVLLETLGAGGMGVVHAAYDPRLDRRVALKLVHPDVAGPGTSVEGRLVREAQAMARLSHPNVVQIHEVGLWEGRIFIAMELVAGRTLAAWLAAGDRSWREVVAVFVEAGRGLAAAHAAGVVHRDFKPENVLVGDDGRVRVTDFGLARGRDGDGGDAWREPNDPMVALASGARTVSGALAGTPGYMSPEQFLGETVTPASDQFSFCVALHQALHGVHPFPGVDRTELARCVIAGERREPPRLRCPRKVHRAVVRGLARVPAQRFAGIEALLAEIVPRSPWRLVAPAAALSLVGAAAIAATTRPHDERCIDAGSLLAGTWDAEQRANLEQVFAASDLPERALLWTSTADMLDGYAGAMSDVYRHSCQAERRGENSSSLHDLRVACLRRRLDVVRGVVRRLGEGDAEALRQAPVAVSGLDDLGVCTDDRALLLGMDPPPPDQADVLVRIQSEIDEARALELVGALAESETSIVEVLAQARLLGHAPTLAEALLQRGRLAVLGHDAAVADASLREAWTLAVASRHDTLIPELGCLRVQQACVAGMGKLAVAQDLLHQADAWQRRIAVTPLQQAEFVLSQGLVSEFAGDHAAAASASRRAIELRAQILGDDHLRVAIARINRGNQLALAGHTAEALGELRKALEVVTRKVGGDHPLVADAHYNLGAALLDEASPKALDEAVIHLEASYRTFAAFAGDVPRVELADSHIALGKVAYLREDLDEAERRVAGALAVYEHHPDHPERAVAMSFRAALAFQRGRHADAAAMHLQARALFVQSSGEASENVAITDGNLGEVLLDQGDAEAARLRFAAAIRSIEVAQGADALALRVPMRGLARALLALDRDCDARTVLTRAAALGPVDGDVVPDAEMGALEQKAAASCDASREARPGRMVHRRVELSAPMIP